MELIAEADGLNKELAAQYNGILNSTTYKALLSRKYSGVDGTELWEMQRSKFVDHAYLVAEALISVAELKTQTPVLIKKMDKARRLWDRLAEYCYDEGRYKNYDESKANAKLISQAIEGVKGLEKQLEKVNQQLQYEQLGIRSTSYYSMDWGHNPVYVADLGSGWKELKGYIHYQVDISACEELDFVPVRLLTSKLSYKAVPGTHTLTSITPSISGAYKNDTGKGSRHQYRGDTYVVPSEINQQRTMQIVDKVFLIEVEECFWGIDHFSAENGLRFTMSMNDQSYVIASGKLFDENSQLPGGMQNVEELVELHTKEGGYLMAASSLRLLTKEELQGYSASELRLIRNEIFARHGYIFKSKDLSSYFSTKSWYSPNTTDVTLSTIETKNVKLIKSLE
ncbi:YARHG domain-containing protein [Vibrio hannami]|uniref:YARHG domain-containing protein n=1 Tax=Vibrio hannami TaxID=2717094 RepID=UPI0024108D3B|nr:YARHG domain-containing protein [Vibrio hannami]MDG3087752.1 YARHG domain-containing protein [Vibrio hannami]